MADPKLTAKISADSKELDKSLKRTTQEIKKVSQEATKAQQQAKQSVAQVADSLNKSGTEAAKSLSKMAMGMSSVAAWGMAVVGALKQIYDLYQNYVNKAMERSLELSRQSTNSLTQATDANVNKWQKATAALKEYYALQKQMASNPNAVTAERLRQSGKGLEGYGIRGNSAEEQLEFAKQQEIKALEGAIKGLEKEQNRLDDLIGKTSDKTEGGINLINNLQNQKNTNAEKKRLYEMQLHDLQSTDIAGNYAREQLAEKQDQTNRQIIAAQQEQIKAQQDLKTAEKDYARALQSARNAQAQLDAVKRQQARDARAERISNRRENLQSQMAAFGFALSDGFNVDLKGKALSDRRRQIKLDASISEKLAKQESGERVHWTTQERNRIKDYQRLQGKDKQLEAQQKQMEAADRQKQAADALQSAANALNAAMGNTTLARRGVIGARGKVSEAGRRILGAKNAWWEIEASKWALDKADEQKAIEAQQKQIQKQEAAKNKLPDGYGIDWQRVLNSPKLEAGGVFKYPTKGEMQKWDYNGKLDTIITELKDSKIIIK